MNSRESGSQARAFKKYQKKNRKYLSLYSKWINAKTRCKEQKEKLNLKIEMLKYRVEELEFLNGTYKEYVKKENR